MGSKTRSQGQIKKMPCGRCTSNISYQIALKIGQNVCLNETLDESEFESPGVIKSIGQIKELPYGRSRGHISCSTVLKFDWNVWNVCLVEILDEFELGSPGVKN